MRIIRSLGLLAPLALVSCGYTPLYAPGGGAAEAAQYMQVGDVSMGTIRTEYTGGLSPNRNVGMRRVAQTVARELKFHFPSSGPEADTLNVVINENTNTLAVESTASISRAEIMLSGYITLVSPDGKTLFKTVINSRAPYNVEKTPFSTESGKNYARQVAARNMAAEIAQRMALHYRAKKPAR